MTEREQELFDLLKKEKLTKEEEKKVKLAAKTLLDKLFNAKPSILIQKWHKEKASRERVMREIQEILGEFLLNPAYGRMVFSRKVDVAFNHIYDMAQHRRRMTA